MSEQTDMMYEHPTLNTIGKATELILGIAVTGYDLDGTNLPTGFEFDYDEGDSGELKL
jgi:hypothetical protein